MPEGVTTLGELADLVRAKNAGPFWVTLDVFLSPAAYAAVVAAGDVDAPAIADLYDVDPADVRLYFLPDLAAVKISIPRRHPQASFRDRDVHSGQQHVPLLGLRLRAGERAS